MSKRFPYAAFVAAASGLSLCLPNLIAKAEEAPPARAATTLLLAAPAETAQTKTASTQMLVRELLRQAILVAARDELGMSTRDGALRESAPDDGADLLSLCPQLPPAGDRHVVLVIREGLDGKGRPLLTKGVSLNVQLAKPFDYSVVAFVAEKLSHTDIVETLKKAGAAGSANRFVRDVQPSEDTLARLSEMNIFSQLTAIRALHEQQRTKGESPATLGALVRAYANLGVLTNHHWNATPKVFHARALLYASRLLRLDERSAFAFRHHAYAAAMAGLPAMAIEDLQIAHHKPPAKDDKSADAPWLPFIERLCRYDFVEMQKNPPPEDCRELAALIAYLTIEFSDCQNQVIVTGRDVLSISPENYYVWDSLMRSGGVSSLHGTTVEAPRILAQSIPVRLRMMPGLPQKVDERLAADAGAESGENADPALAVGTARVALVDELVTAGTSANDRQEPSWQAVGRLIEDLTLIHIYHRLRFFQVSLDLPRDSYTDEYAQALKIVAKHPYAPVIDSMEFDSVRDPDAVKRVLATLPLDDVGLPILYFSGVLKNQEIRNLIFAPAVRHSDAVAYDLEILAARLQDTQSAYALQAVSPHSPQAIALLIQHDEERLRPQFKRWEERYPQYPGVQRALAIAYQHANQSEDAMRCFTRSVELSPDQAAYLEFADALWKQENYDEWKRVLLLSLEQEDFALSHARVRVRIARYHMNRREWKEAVEYADEAAGTGAAWAMMCASECHEALEDWEVSEALMKAVSTRYAAQQMEWYFWCRRTGRGEVDAAQAVARNLVPQTKTRLTAYDAARLGVYHRLSGDKQRACGAFVTEFNIGASVGSGLQVALLSDELGNTANRDAALAGIVSEKGQKMNAKTPSYKAMASFAEWLNETYHLPADGTPDMEKLDAIAASPADAGTPNLLFYIGQYCADHKDWGRARKYFAAAIAADTQQLWCTTMASAALRDLPQAEGKPDEPKVEKPAKELEKP